MLLVCLTICCVGIASLKASEPPIARKAAEERSRGDFEGAIADYNKAIERAPNDNGLYYNRGICYFARGEWDRAIADLQKGQELSQQSTLLPTVLIWAARAEIGDRKAADEVLNLNLNVARDTASPTPNPLSRSPNFDRAESEFQKGAFAGNLEQRRRAQAEIDSWPTATIKLLAGLLAEQGYLSKEPSFIRRTESGKLDAESTQDPRHSCEPLFYAGLKRFVDGDKETAAKYFREIAAATCPTAGTQRELARALLRNVLHER